MLERVDFAVAKLEVSLRTAYIGSQEATGAVGGIRGPRIVEPGLFLVIMAKRR